MPQLIAMVIVVVGAMIYMFQTFGGTGDKIEGVAQKASIITEINNIKDGVKIAAKSGHIGDGTSDPADAVVNLAGLGTLSYFAEQINEQVKANASANTYNAISFGGAKDSATPAMQISLVASKAVGTVKMIPGIFVDLSKGSLKDNKAFLEAQIATDLSTIAYIDRAATTAVAATTARGTTTDLDKRTPSDTKATPSAAELADGTFIIYFKDFGSDEVVQ
jgi:hypothetical protein